jgi:hypothetical protein
VEPQPIRQSIIALADHRVYNLASLSFSRHAGDVG